MTFFVLFDLVLALALFVAVPVLFLTGHPTEALLCGIWQEILSVGLILRRLFDKKWPVK